MKYAVSMLIALFLLYPAFGLEIQRHRILDGKFFRREGHRVFKGKFRERLRKPETKPADKAPPPLAPKPVPKAKTLRTVC